MATAALPTQTESSSWRADLMTPAALRALGVAVLVAFGTLAFYPLWHELSELWSADPLRSIGAAFPFIAFAGVIRAWRRLGWELNGTWWGLIPVALTLPLGRLTSDSVLQVVLRGHHFSLVHPGVVFLLYGIGTTLLFGGRPLLRASIAPLLLLLAVNPVPFCLQHAGRPAAAGNFSQYGAWLFAADWSAPHRGAAQDDVFTGLWHADCSGL